MIIAFEQYELSVFVASCCVEAVLHGHRLVGRSVHEQHGAGVAVDGLVHVDVLGNAEVVAAEAGHLGAAFGQIGVAQIDALGDVYGVKGHAKHAARARGIDNDDGGRHGNDGLEVVGAQGGNQHGEESSLAVAAEIELTYPVKPLGVVDDVEHVVNPLEQRVLAKAAPALAVAIQLHAQRCHAYLAQGCRNADDVVLFHMTGQPMLHDAERAALGIALGHLKLCMDGNAVAIDKELLHDGLLGVGV